MMSWIRIKWPWLVLREYPVAYCYHSKAGCTSIANALARAVNRTDKPTHKAFQGYFETMEDFIAQNRQEEFFTFTFVRNPWARLVSCYEDRIRRKNARGFPRSRFQRFMTFDEFICAVAFDVFENAHFYPYWQWMVHDGKLFPHFIGRVETMNQDWKELQKICPMPLPDLKHLNKCRHRDYRKYYTDETQQIVGSLYEADINLFDFRFGE